MLVMWIQTRIVLLVSVLVEIVLLKLCVVGGLIVNVGSARRLVCVLLLCIFLVAICVLCLINGSKWCRSLWLIISVLSMLCAMFGCLICCMIFFVVVVVVDWLYDDEVVEFYFVRFGQ